MKINLLICLLGVVYTLGLFSLLIVHFSGEGVATERATILMGLGLFSIWVLIGGTLQFMLRSKLRGFFATQKKPYLAFLVGALVFSLLEEAIATLMTNAARLLGDPSGTAHITGSTNYFEVIGLHSVIVFIPMLAMLGLFLKRYELSPRTAALLWGSTGLIGEYTLAGPLVFMNAPFWFLVYGLMVYTPAHSFMYTKRLPVRWYHIPLCIICVLLAAITTFWIPFALR